MEINHKRGASFEKTGFELLDGDNEAIDVTDYTIASQVRTQCGKLVADLDLVIAGDGLSLTLSKTDTTEWPRTSLHFDVRYISPDGVIRFSETHKIHVGEAVTRD